MISTGIVRAIDPLGRIVIPIELRRTLNINEGDPVEIFTEGEQVILRKHEVGCKECGEMKGIKEVPGVKDLYLCPKCLKNLYAALKKEVDKK